jgi:putative SOS response-associated peptidase YedK
MVQHSRETATFCVISTRPPNSGNSPHRMPAILRREDWETWLSGSADEAMAVLKAYPADLMLAHEVSAKVNSPKNNDATLIEPVMART